MLTTSQWRSAHRTLVYLQLRFEDWREERKMDGDPNTSPCKPTSCLHGINWLWFNLSHVSEPDDLFFFDGTSGNIIKTPSPKWLGRNYFCKLFVTSTDVSSFWTASDRTSQGQMEEEEEEEKRPGGGKKVLSLQDPLRKATIYHLNLENCCH